MTTHTVEIKTVAMRPDGGMRTVEDLIPMMTDAQLVGELALADGVYLKTSRHDSDRELLWKRDMAEVTSGGRTRELRFLTLCTENAQVAAAYRARVAELKGN